MKDGPATIASAVAKPASSYTDVVTGERRPGYDHRSELASMHDAAPERIPINPMKTALPKKKKIVILGGGLGSLSTALMLTESSDWKERFESITVYQMGWRLGGKGASGRNQRANDRIEEHGLHVWMGWYANAFRVIQRVYRELGRPPDAPLATWDQAFKKHDFIVLGEEVNGEWKNWPLAFPTDDEVPGTGGEFPSVWSYVELTVHGLFELLKGSVLVAPKPTEKRTQHPLSPAGWIEYLARKVLIGVRSLLEVVRVGEDLVLLTAGERLLHDARELARTAARHHARDVEGDHDERMVHLLTSFRHWLRHRLEHELEETDEARRLFFILDTGIACVRGILAEGIGRHAHALDALDAYDFREFLSNHGATDDTVQSSLIRAFYDLLFAYRNGDPSDQKVGAGVALRFIFRMCLTFKGAIFWKMQAGMGDTIFGPMYEVLKRRGVRFELFHRVRSVSVSKKRIEGDSDAADLSKKRIEGDSDAAGVSTKRIEGDPDAADVSTVANRGMAAEPSNSVERIVIGRQVTLKNGTYEPLYDVKGLPCWPSEPLYDQLVEGDELRAAGIDLESIWSPWEDRETITLERGRDFDVVVFGISLASIPFVAPELVEASDRWKNVVDRVETVRTQAVQLWLKPDLAGLGWQMPGAVADAYPEPLDTWADMSHLIGRERWDGAAPGNVTYFCAPMIGGIPPSDDPDVPERERRKVRDAAAAWLSRNVAVMWPRATDAAQALNWDLLIDPQHRTGEARLDAQYFRANVDPSERYVLSVPGSTEYRLRAHETGFDNLVVAGDWTYTGVNAGCVEGTVISGMLASNAVCGYPKLADVVGYANP